MWKICTKCKKHKALWEFYKDIRVEFSVKVRCKLCIITDCLDRYYKNRERYKAKTLAYYYKNLEEKQKYQLMYDKKIPREIKLRRKKKHREGKAIYKTFKDALSIDEKPRLVKNGKYLEVKCKFCRKYFTPTYAEASRRVTALNSTTGEENNLYCSEECKAACPIYRSQGNIPSVSFREAVPQELRDEILQRNDGMCEMCGENLSEIIHHEKPVATHPHLQLDKDNLWGVCKNCHYNICHQLEGCTLPELRKKSINNCSIEERNEKDE